MRRMLVAALAVGALTATTMPAFADGTGTVLAHVSVAAPCITVSTPSVDFGTAPLTTSNANPADYIPRPLTIDTCAMSEALLARGSDAISGGGMATSWGLGPPSTICPATEVYSEAFGYQVNPLAGVSWVPLTTTDQFAFGSGDNSRIGPGPSNVFLGLRMPCAGSEFGNVMNFSYVFTAMV